MSHLMPDWSLSNASKYYYTRKLSPNVSMLPDSGLSTEHNSWVQDSTNDFYFGPTEADEFSDFFGISSGVELSPTLPMQALTSIVTEREFLPEIHVGDASETKTKSHEMDEIDGVARQLKRKQNHRPKRTRSSEMHNMSERRRRDRIKGKMRALQELIPDCHKSDRASILDDAINYIKALKLQVEMMSAGGSALCQTPYMSPAGVQSMQIPHFPSFMHMRPGMGMGMGFGMGMVGKCYSTGLPVMSVPSASIHPSPLAIAGLHLMREPGNLPVPQVQMPFIHSQASPAAATSSTMIPMFVSGFSPALYFTNQGESSSHNIPSIPIDHQQMPMIDQKGIPSSLNSTMPMILLIKTSTGENVMAEAFQFYKEASCSDSNQIIEEILQ